MLSHLRGRRAPDTTVLYFAHNEHVSVRSHKKGLWGASAPYVADGAYLRLAEGRGRPYRSIGTYAPSLWAYWGKMTPRRVLERSPETKRYCAGKKPRGAFIMKKAASTTLGGFYATSDFDIVVCDTRPNAFVNDSPAKS